MNRVSAHIFLPLIFAAVAGDQLALVAQPRVTHGPIVGAVTPGSAKLLIRVDSSAEVGFDLALDSGFVNPISSESDSAYSSFDFFATIEIDGLEPDTRYYYRPLVDGVPQGEVGHFTTFPVEGLAYTFTFAFGSCQQNVGDPNSYIGRVFPVIVRDGPRFFLQLGDWTYPDTTDNAQNPRDYFNVKFSRVQASYRSKYDPDYPMAELFRVTSLDYVYDDHDFSNNNSDMSFPGRANSLRGYREMFPHYSLPNPENGLWHKFTFANADFFVLDTRTQRHPNSAAFQQDSTGRYAYRNTAGHFILDGDPSISGQLQMDWLVQELRATKADWKFICTSVPFNPGLRSFTELAIDLQGGALEGLVQQFGFRSVADLAISIADSWNGFPTSVEKLVSAVHQAGIENVIVLSGDTHTAAIDDGANSLFPEIMAGALDRTNSRAVTAGELVGINPWNRGGQTLARNNYRNHYGRVTVFGADSVLLELIDETGELISSRTQPGGHIVSPAALSYAFQQQNFGGVGVGTSAELSFILINTGADTLGVNIVSSTPEFVPSFQSVNIPVGVRTDLWVTFEPHSEGTFQGNLFVHSDDPQSPAVIPLRGVGIAPTGVDGLPAIPEQVILNQNYPNPFNPTTRITYHLSSISVVELTVYNQLGRTIRQLVHTQQPAGHYFVDWDGRDRQARPVASGIYLYKLKAGSFSETRKMLLLR